MENEPKFEVASRGPEFALGQKVKMVEPESENGRMFTVRAVEVSFRPSTGEHDDMGPYKYQLVELEENPGVKIAADRLKPADGE